MHRRQRVCDSYKGLKVGDSDCLYLSLYQVPWVRRENMEAVLKVTLESSTKNVRCLHADHL